MAAPRHLAVLIRHGDYHQRADTPSALQPFPLTETGRAQAQDCGQQIAGLIATHGADLMPVVHCSPQLRAWQTARAIADHLIATGHGVDQLCETPALSERGLGSAANLMIAEIEAVLQADPRYAPAPKGWKSDSTYRLPLDGAESLMDAGARVAGHIQTTIDASPTGPRPTMTLFVGHGASFRHAAHQLGVLKYDEIAKISMFHARPLLLCYNDDGNWAHFDGAWKSRSRQDRHMD